MKNRQQGLDRLRILSAYFVVCIHLFALLGDFSGRGVSLLANALVYALVFCAVNCFGLLSGWLGYREDNNSLRLSSLTVLWLQFVFYRVLFLLLPALLHVAAPVNLADIFLPVTRRVNWYMTAYFEMMLLAPAINLVVQRFSRGTNAAICCVIFGVTVVSTALRAVMDCDPFLLGEGYNWMWLAVLYFLGASVKKHGWLAELPEKYLRLILAASLLVTALWRWGMQSIFSTEGFPGNTGKIFFSYTSPTIALAAMCLLAMHIRMKTKENAAGLLEKASSAALGVFLLHTTVWNWVIAPCAGLLSHLPQNFAWLNVLISALIITLLCIPVDLFRGWLFRKLRVHKLASAVQARAFALCGKIEEKAK